ncbi:long-chain acyl-CoA synthetase [Thermosyntropha lipolytica DSM 11003]|uniref:Long-chain acyl-CoA synthetase n=1 Tax=Thermosyntropha lipolytica DSM 11003 TaxID=1123382 RepID=A0A1M5QLV1_9FIRM|nr:long-chain fatty acid--CoA ligase [Thermosyntropha lipolytica]SHH14968.1 long-chain acyl-CoA synthetase [Thermosyntropha lipolytica DSM 11003]
MEMLERFEKEVKTLPRMFYNTVENFPEHPAMKFKMEGTYVTLSYKGFADIVQEIANGLLSLGVTKGTPIGLMAHTSERWGWADFAIQCAGGITVTIYPTLSAGEASFILKHSEARLLFAGNSDIALRIETAWHNLPDLEYIIVMNSTYQGDNPKIMNLSELRDRGKAYALQNPLALQNRWESLKGSDPSSIIYTSGTTGNLKGSLLNHEDLIGALARSLKHMEIGGYPVTYNDVAFSLLPLAHIWERNNSYLAMISVGGCIGYAEKPTTLVQDIQQIKPTWVLLVPRLWDRIYAGFKGAFCSSPEGKELFEWAYKVGEKVLAKRTKPNGAIDLTEDPTKYLDEELAREFKKADAMVYSQLRQFLGGNLKIPYSGGGHLPPDLHRNYLVLNFPLLNGWGLTETAAGISHGYPNATKIGWLSPMVPGVEAKLDEDGEILVRGVGIIREYYKNPEETKLAFTEDGWFRTGDIGEFDEDGFLRIIERKKHIIVMDTGKNVAPAKIESKFINSPVIEQVVVLGDNRKFIAALLVPAFDIILYMMKEKGIPFDETKLKYAEINGINTCIEVGEDVISHPMVKELIAEEVKRINQYLEDYETIKDYRILPHKLTEERGELTPTLKVKRKVIMEKYRDLIEDIYK